MDESLTKAASILKLPPAYLQWMSPLQKAAPVSELPPAYLQWMSPLQKAAPVSELTLAYLQWMRPVQKAAHFRTDPIISLYMRHLKKVICAWRWYYEDFRRSEKGDFTVVLLSTPFVVFVWFCFHSGLLCFGSLLLLWFLALKHALYLDLQLSNQSVGFANLVVSYLGL